MNGGSKGEELEKGKGKYKVKEINDWGFSGHLWSSSVPDHVRQELENKPGLGVLLHQNLYLVALWSQGNAGLGGLPNAVGGHLQGVN